MVVRGLTLLFGASSVGAVGCSLIAQLTNEDFSTLADASVGTDAPSTSADGSASTDGAPFTDAMAPPIDARSVIDDLTGCDGGGSVGWSLDCDFAAGGYLELKVVATENAPVAEIDLQDPTQLLIVGDQTGADSFLITMASRVVKQTQLLPIGRPVDVAAVPPGNAASAVVLTDVSTDAGNGVGLLVVGIPPQGDFLAETLVPKGESLHAFELETFTGDTQVLVLANHAEPVEMYPALVQIDLVGDAGSVVDIDTRDDGGDRVPQAVTAAAIGSNGGWIGTTIASEGSLIQLSSDGVLNGKPIRTISLPTMSVNGGIATFAQGPIVAIGTASDPANVPLTGVGALDVEPTGPVGSPTVIDGAQQMVKFVQFFHGDGFYAVALSGDGLRITLLHFERTNAGVAIAAPTAPMQAGVAFTRMLPAAASSIGSATYYDGDICFTLNFPGDPTNVAQARDVLACLKDYGSGEGSVDAGDGGDADASDARDE